MRSQGPRGLCWPCPGVHGLACRDGEVGGSVGPGAGLGGRPECPAQPPGPGVRAASPAQRAFRREEGRRLLDAGGRAGGGSARTAGTVCRKDAGEQDTRGPVFRALPSPRTEWQCLGLSLWGPPTSKLRDPHGAPSRAPTCPLSHPRVSGLMLWLPAAWWWANSPEARPSAPGSVLPAGPVAGGRGCGREGRRAGGRLQERQGAVGSAPQGGPACAPACELFESRHTQGRAGHAEDSPCSPLPAARPCTWVVWREPQVQLCFSKCL